MLITYNLPPWLCMKPEYLTLTLLILGPQFPGKDMDGFLWPLIDVLNDLRVNGLETRNAAFETVCLECGLCFCGQSMIHRQEVLSPGVVDRVTERVLLVMRIHHPCG